MTKTKYGAYEDDILYMFFDENWRDPGQKNTEIVKELKEKER